MSDELNLMLLAVKNYAKSEYDSMSVSNSEDTETLKGLRKWIKSELEEYSTFHCGIPDMSGEPEWNQKLGYYRCITTLERVLR